ncbi:DUF3800 domain-containing protein [Hamadaea sp. NPDC051192]|uniref:DUF3800 domain-containing protein n=1 Tax=Hamadaea sp. NPDC051192 TaxID=3154940 RepID=UPI00341B66FE
MHFLYLDESGGVEEPDSHPAATPAMIILGLIVHADLVPELTSEFLDFKRRNFPSLFQAGPALDHILREMKGSALLGKTRSESRDRRRHAQHVRYGLLQLVDRFGCRIIGRVWVKRSGERLKPAATYGFSMQDIATHFVRYLKENRSTGMIIADSRNPGQNIEVAHSIFTQKWRTGDDPYRRLLEVPTFAHSDNHAGIQIADMLASMITLPMVAAAYGASPGTIHDSPRYAEVREKHGDALQALQFRYFDGTGRTRGGIVVSDAVAARPSAMLFRASGFGAEVVSEGELEITIPVQAGAAATAGSVGPAR